MTNNTMSLVAGKTRQPRISPAEQRILDLLINSYELEEVAEKLGIAYETARKHLKAVYAKVAYLGIKPKQHCTLLWWLKYRITGYYVPDEQDAVMKILAGLCAAGRKGEAGTYEYVAFENELIHLVGGVEVMA